MTFTAPLPSKQQALHLPAPACHGIDQRLCSGQAAARKYTQISPRLPSKSRKAENNLSLRWGTGVQLSAVSNGAAGLSQEQISYDTLVEVAKNAAEAGAQVVYDALDKPKNISYKGVTDLVTDTDKAAEAAILTVLQREFPQHAFLGEEGGVSGNSASQYLWAIDPLDGTTNFSHCYPSFGVSVAVLLKGQPVAAVVYEFAGGPHAWVTRIFRATEGGGAFCNDVPISVSDTDSITRSLLVTGFGYDHDDAWSQNIELFKTFTDISQGVRRLGAAAVDMCHVALGVSDAFWEFRLKPWDVSAGVLMVKEAGGRVSTMDGEPYSVFSRSALVSNGHLHDDILQETAPRTEALKKKGVDLSPWYVPSGYEFEEV